MQLAQQKTHFLQNKLFSCKYFKTLWTWKEKNLKNSHATYFYFRKKFVRHLVFVLMIFRPFFFSAIFLLLPFLFRFLFPFPVFTGKFFPTRVADQVPELGCSGIIRRRRRRQETSPKLLVVNAAVVLVEGVDSPRNSIEIGINNF